METILLNQDDIVRKIAKLRQNITKSFLLNQKIRYLTSQNLETLNLNNINKLLSMRYKNKLFKAAHSNKTGYNFIWIRDNVYATLGLELFDINLALESYHALFDLFHKYKYKIDNVIVKKPEYAWQYIHPRYDPELNEVNESWGWKQHDAIGLFLFSIARLLNNNINPFRNTDDEEIIQKLIYYLNSVQYWHDPDNGIWENEETLHASSISACLSALRLLKPYFDIPEHMIIKGAKSLARLLPAESSLRADDFALLSLIWPFNVVNKHFAKQIIRRIELRLLRKNGAIRYHGDWYYSNENGEAEWVMALPWLTIVHSRLGNRTNALIYLIRTIEVMNDLGELAELYLSGTDEYNENTPLAWNHALMSYAISYVTSPYQTQTLGEK